MKKVHLICNAHIDPIWQWDWQEGVSATLSTFKSAVELSKEFDYIFCHNEVTLYKYIEEYAPALFNEIKELVRKGKWRIMGGWYLQPDCNMPSGESFVRQIMTGKKYFLGKFGVQSTVAINYDPFGHTRGLVQIIKKCGQDSMIFMRPAPFQLELPAEQFLWEGYDGSRIKCARTYCYNTALGSAEKEIRERIDMQKDEEIAFVNWGVGNHGGGPSRKDLTDIKNMIENTDKYEIIHSYPEKFFEEINPTAVYNGSLHISMPGGYVSMSRVKRKHIKLENELYLTEKICSLATLSGVMEYPEKKFEEITEDLLNAEFHDTLPGTVIQAGEENALNYLGHGILEAEKLKTRAFFALSEMLPSAREGEYPIVIFNPAPYGGIFNVECEISRADYSFDEETKTAILVLDENGKEVKSQIIKEESNQNFEWRKRVIFEAELKPMSLKRFSFYPIYVKKTEEELAQKLPFDRRAKEEYVFDNGRKRVEIDKKTGLLKEYSINGKTFIKDAFLPVWFDDNCDPWGMSRQQMKRLGENEENFLFSKKPDGVFAGLKSIQVIENGDLLLSIEAFFEKGSTRARVLYKIYKNNDDVDIDVSLFMGDVDKIIKLKVPVCEQGKLIGQTAFGTEELFMDGRENVSQRFIAVKGQEQCLAIFNNCTYGSSFENGNLYISLLRGASYCAHPVGERPIIPTDRFIKKIDQGENTFSFRLTVANENELETLAQEFNQKPYAVNIFPLVKQGMNIMPFNVLIENKNVNLVAFKKKLNSDEYILRLLNNSEKCAQTGLCVGECRLDVSFRKYEVKTVVFDGKTLFESSILEI